MRFGRRKQDDLPEDVDDLAADATEVVPATGPFDEADVDLEQLQGIDLGSLVLVPDGQMELRLEVDESTGEVSAALLLGEDGALELRAFAASRGGDAWAELRPRISGEIAQMGGTATPQEGTFGTELLCVVPLQTEDGQPVSQVSRIVGHQQGSWLLRATLMGPAAVEEEAAPRWEETIRRVVVRRGKDARVPGSPLPLRLPPEARRVE